MEALVVLLTLSFMLSWVPAVYLTRVIECTPQPNVRRSSTDA
jgi:hypothetical protein